MPRLITLIFVLLCLVPGVPALAAPLHVVVSIAPQKFLLERLAGDEVKVTVLVKPGSDPHAYEPSPSQLREAGAARAWLTIGVPFEDAWLPRITGVAPELTVISTIEGLRRLSSDEAAQFHKHEKPADTEHDAHDGDGHGHPHGGEDPHVWLSPMLVREMLPGMARALGKLLPEKAADFRRNARSLSSELEALDEELALRFNEVPQEKRVFLTYHPSWRYFAFNYGLTELSIEEGGKEPGPKSLKAVTDKARSLGIRSVFVEPQFPKASARAVADAIGGDIVEADPLEPDLIRSYTGMAEKLLKAFPR